MNKAVKLLIALVACILTGTIGYFLTSPYIKSWYALINKPSWTPPNWLFGPVWTILFLLMGLALYLIVSGKKSKDATDAVLVFAAQLLVNASWSLLFFTLHKPLYAFIALISLWLLILASIMMFHRLNKLAAYLLLPYLAWVSFAGALNLAIYFLNR